MTDSATPAAENVVAGDAPVVSERAPRNSAAAEPDFPSELRLLRKMRLFWLGVGLKTIASLLFGSHFATRWFAPFLYDFVHGHFSDPWAHALHNGEPMAFPYGPGMLAALSVSWFPALFVSFDPASHFGLFLLRLPLFAADLTICVLLMRWLRMRARDVVIAYWLNPIVLYATYVHGQLDLIPTAFLCLALFFVFVHRTVIGAVIFGIALATKLHLLVAFPFVVVFLFRRRNRDRSWLLFSAVTIVTTAALYALPMTSFAFREMVLGSAESKKLWTVVVPYSTTGSPVLYVAPAALLVALMRFVSYRKVNRELTLMFIGALYVCLVALVPPQPGWFIWSIPFVAYLGARFTRTGRFALFALSTSYLLYFFVADPVVFLESLDPTFGAGTGAHLAAWLTSVFPPVFSPRGDSIAWTILFSATGLAAFEMYRKGVRSNSMYMFRDQSFMIGIGGDSGAGKHTVGADLAAIMGADISLVNGDDDHRWERGHAMWRRYTHLDPRGNQLESQMLSLAALKRGGDVRRRHYDHDRGRFTEALVLKPNDFIAIIGLHPFYLASQRQLFHLKVFIDTEESLRREWKSARDIEKRGYTREKVIEQIEQRMADSVKYVRPQAKHADLVLRHCPGAEKSDAGVSLEVEVVSELEPLVLVDLLDRIPTLEVEWEPDETLTRDRLKIKGDIDIDAVRALAYALIPDLDELVFDPSSRWLSGGRGIAQVILLHSIGSRLRRSAAANEAVA